MTAAHVIKTNNKLSALNCDESWLPCWVEWHRLPFHWAIGNSGTKTLYRSLSGIIWYPDPLSPALTEKGYKVSQSLESLREYKGKNITGSSAFSCFCFSFWHCFTEVYKVGKPALWHNIYIYSLYLFIFNSFIYVHFMIPFGTPYPGKATWQLQEQRYPVLQVGGRG